MTRLAIHYRRQFFGESTTVRPAGSAASGEPRGLVGRQVANAEMLSALLRYGSDDVVTFLVDQDADQRELRATLGRLLPAGKTAVTRRLGALEAWMAEAKQCVVWEPQPPSATLAWTRARVAPSHIAIAGLTHALCSSLAVSALRDLVAAPLRRFDRLVCTSEAVAHTAQMLIEHAAALAGKDPAAEMIALETIPLGVDCQRHRPATEEERAAIRQRLDIPSHADVVLFVGRLSHHAKSNPLPMYAACQRAALRTGRPVHLLLAGWYASQAVEQAFQRDARRVAPDVSVRSIPAMDAAWRDSIWAAADLFVSLADSVQETFGLTVVEAMSRRLAVVASDWNGYRETIRHEQTGLLVPTAMVCGAGERALLAMHEGRLSYDHFLAAVGQTVCVSTAAACDAVERLLSAPQERAAFAEAGYQHAREHFAWPGIIARYERLWSEQRATMRRCSVPAKSVNDRLPAPPERPNRLVPSLRELFSLYPTAWIDADAGLVAGGQFLGDVVAVEQSPLANHSERWRLDAAGLSRLVSPLLTADRTATSIRQLLERHAGDERLLDTIAWAIKFDLLRPQSLGPVGQCGSVRSIPPAAPDITFTTTCMGRLAHLQQTLPAMVGQANCHVVLIDYSCPEQAGRWAREHYSPDQVTVVEIAGRTQFELSEAKNAGIHAARTPWICLIDADVLLADGAADQMRRRLHPHHFLRCLTAWEGVGGTIVASRQALLQVGGHDPIYQGWGEEDDDLIDALLFIGERADALPQSWISHLHHDDALRTRFHEQSDRRQTQLCNRIYRAIKWDMAKIHGEVASLDRRRQLYASIRAQLEAALRTGSPAEITISLGEGRWSVLAARGTRALRYRVEFDEAAS